MTYAGLARFAPQARTGWLLAIPRDIPLNPRWTRGTGISCPGRTGPAQTPAPPFPLASPAGPSPKGQVPTPPPPCPNHRCAVAGDPTGCGLHSLRSLGVRCAHPVYALAPRGGRGFAPGFLDRRLGAPGVRGKPGRPQETGSPPGLSRGLRLLAWTARTPFGGCKACDVVGHLREFTTDGLRVTETNRCSSDPEETFIVTMIQRQVSASERSTAGHQ